MDYIFGPVPSRRLGLSLGVDLIPAKTCTYDCLYCQVGRTTQKTVEISAFVPVQRVLGELKKRLEIFRPDAVTLSGSGEPTLYSEIDHVIGSIKGITDVPVAILTNGSLLWREEVRRRVAGADIIMPTLTTAYEETFIIIHRSHPDLNVGRVIEGLVHLRQMYKGHLFLEIFLLAGINDNEKELEGLTRVIEEISPDKIQLNTVVRPPSDPRALSLDIKRLEEIRKLFGERAEIIVETPLRRKRGKHDALAETILEMARRRPLRAVDIANVCDIPLGDAEAIVRELKVKKGLRQQEHSGELYYLLG